LTFQLDWGGYRKRIIERIYMMNIGINKIRFGDPDALHEMVKQKKMDLAS